MWLPPNIRQTRDGVEKDLGVSFDFYPPGASRDSTAVSIKLTLMFD